MSKIREDENGDRGTGGQGGIKNQKSNPGRFLKCWRRVLSKNSFFHLILVSLGAKRCSKNQTPRQNWVFDLINQPPRGAWFENEVFDFTPLYDKMMALTDLDLIFDTLWCASNAYFEPSRSFIVLWLVHYRTPLFVKTVPDRFFPVTFENLLTMKSMFWAVVLIVVETALAEVTISKVVQPIYDRSPKLRIEGSGFDADEHDILITLGSQNQPALKLGQDFSLTKDDDGLILKLLSVRRWEQTPNLSYNNVCIVLPRANHRNHDASKFPKITM